MESLSAVERGALVVSVEHHPLPLFTLRLRVEAPYPSVHPGQFAMVQAPTTLEPYLRRAFSVFTLQRAGESVGEGLELEIHGKVIGPGTAALAAAVPGRTLRLLSPVGRGCCLSGGGRAVLVAGGVGSAALSMLAEELVARRVEFDFVYGGRGQSDLAHGDRFGELARASGGEYFPVTEDGSHGERGLVTAPLSRLLHQGRCQRIFTCGPDPMMKAVCSLAEEHGAAVQAALETPMGCGYGACLGCVVPRRDGGLALCCRVGPVFDGREVAW